MHERYPGVQSALDYHDPFTLVVCVMLSAQTTDAGVNRVTPELFSRWPTPQAMAQADPAEVGEVIHSIGFWRAKAAHCVELSQMIMSDFGGEVPHTMEELCRLPGVGRKTANLILGDVFRVPGSVVVDTHCIRLSNRMGLVDDLKDPPKIEAELRKLLPPEHSSDFCHCLVLHGRAVCDARKPNCGACCVKHLCQHFSGD